ncbi:hypothetical protein EJB05_27462, partial [Eragrostis curvula]
LETTRKAARLSSLSTSNVHTMVAAPARDGQTTLALRLAKHLAPSPAAAAAGNVAFSPVSVHAALALVAAGARGETQAQLLDFLGAPSAADLADFGRFVSRSVLVDRELWDGPRVLFGGGVWVDAARGEIADAFRRVALKSYKSKARTVNFAKEPEKAVKRINKWVKKATADLIDTIISPEDINAKTDLVLANAVYFKGKWLKPFLASWTFRATFHRLDGRHVEAEFMSAHATQQVACMDGFKVLKLPYEPGWKELEAAGCKRKRKSRRSACASAEKEATESLDEDGGDAQYSMFIFLPDTRDGVAAMVDAVTASPACLYGVLDKVKEAYVELMLPKFKIAFSWRQLSDALRQLGLSLPFSPATADLSGMCDEDDAVDEEDGGGDGDGLRRPLFVSNIAHLSVVEVNEMGTEAAAVTMSVLYGCGRPPREKVEFVADHPFTFFIMEERSGVIVFAGHVLDPTQG